jgi:hypothetical protein
MKKHLIFAFWLLCLCQSQAQNNPYLQPNFQVAERNYICTSYTYFVKVISSQNTISVGNTSNYFNNSIQPICRNANIEDEVIHDHVKAIFSAQRRQALAGEQITIGLYVNRSTGVVKEVYFYIKPQSKITPLEVYQLENQLRSITYPQTGLEICPEIEVDFVHRSFMYNFE